MKNYWVTACLTITLIALITLFPSFKLALTGDDYLGYWRFLQHINGHIAGNWNYFNFFFTDYGPQDTFTVLIHHFFGFEPIYYYLASFILRIWAALSFLPLIYTTTKNKWAAFFGGLFFAITETGLETTDWSFNMPSYLAIGIFNFCLLSLYNSQQYKRIKDLLLFSCLFILSIIAQPIRLTFLPLLICIYELYLLLRIHTKSQLTWSFLRLTICFALLIILFSLGNIGNSFGASSIDPSLRAKNVATSLITNNITPLYQSIKKGEYQVFLSPISQIGNITFPTNIVRKDRQILPTRTYLTKITLPLFILFCIIFYLFSPQKLSKRYQTVIVLLTLLLSILIWFFDQYHSTFPLSTSNFIGTIIGILLTILVFHFWYQTKSDINKSSLLILSFGTIVISFVIPWLRNPGFIQETTNRYLIVPAAGLSFLVALSFAFFVKRNRLALSFLIIFLLIHNNASQEYLTHLSTVRNAEKTDAIRRSIPRVPAFDTNEPVVFYLQPTNSEILHHALLFGFPVIMGMQYDFYNVWNVVYTDRWEEITSAYLDGKSLKRFTIPEQKVPLNNIYSYQLEGDTLRDNTAEIRKKLVDLDSKH